jgi:hypothetical protein
MAGQTMPVTYIPSALPRKSPEQLAFADTDEFAAAFCKVVVAWDLIEGDEPVQLQLDFVKQLPVYLLREVMIACIRDAATTLR